MGKKMKLYNLEDISPLHIYELMVQILKDALENSDLQKRLHLKLKDHKILSRNPFLAELKAIQRRWYLATQLIKCTITSKKQETLLKIESSEFEKPQFFDASIHEENIRRLYGELRFRLESEGKPSLDEILQPDEKIIKKFQPVEFKDYQFESIITNFRLLLVRNNLVFRDLNPNRIQGIVLLNVWNRERMPLFVVGIISLLVWGLISFIMLVAGISEVVLMINILLFTLLGVIPVILAIFSRNFYLLINCKEVSIKLYSKKAVLRVINNLLSEITS